MRPQINVHEERVPHCQTDTVPKHEESNHHLLSPANFERNKYQLSLWSLYFLNRIIIGQHTCIQDHIFWSCFGIKKRAPWSNSHWFFSIMSEIISESTLLHNIQSFTNTVYNMTLVIEQNFPFYFTLTVHTGERGLPHGPMTQIHFPIDCIPWNACISCIRICTYIIPPPPPQIKRTKRTNKLLKRGKKNIYYCSARLIAFSKCTVGTSGDRCPDCAPDLIRRSVTFQFGVMMLRNNRLPSTRAFVAALIDICPFPFVSGGSEVMTLLISRIRSFFKKR